MLTIHDAWRRTWLESWPPALVEMSMPHVEILLTGEDVLAIGSHSPLFRRLLLLDDLLPFSHGLIEELDKAVAEFPGGMFPRLGFCSFKDALTTPKPIRRTEDGLRVLGRRHDRSAGFLADAVKRGESTSLFCREYRHIPPWSEFRIFMRDRRFIGISQYRCDRYIPDIDHRMSIIFLALKDFCREFRETSYLPTVIADVFIDLEDEIQKAILIEINPFIERTDPCLYSWRNGGDFDGLFRYVGREG